MLLFISSMLTLAPAIVDYCNAALDVHWTVRSESGCQSDIILGRRHCVLRRAVASPLRSPRPHPYTIARLLTRISITLSCSGVSTTLPLRRALPEHVRPNVAKRSCDVDDDR